MHKVIFLIDMNSYFASVEQRCNPALRGKAIVVCGDGRTVVTTASYEARAYGVKTGMTLPEARRLCPHVIAVRGNMEKYVDTSLNIHNILLEFTGKVEVFSIDECFMDVTDACKESITPRELALKIKKQIREQLGLECSVGIGPNKIAAKLASKLQKPNGLVEITPEKVSGFFAGLKVEEMQGIGIGDKVSAKLKSLGLNTGADIARAPINLLTSHFGVTGYNLKNIGLGRDDSVVKGYWDREEVRSVGHSHTMLRDSSSLNVIKSYLRMLCEKTGARMRKNKLTGKTVSLYIRYGDFSGFGKQRSLKDYINSGYDIYSGACRILETAMPLKKPVRLIGVSVSGLAACRGQSFLFDDMEKNRKIVETVDGINKKYGDFTVKPSSVLIAQRLGMPEGCGMVSRALYKRGGKKI